MKTAPQDDPRQGRPNVVAMPPRQPQPATTADAKTAPGHDHAEQHEEPGYGHGV